ncbi:hypothetical protein [Escherichia coli]|uniref:hypothetical protein n=1 Tax=Escherichia coli TaxID=562 RepID=UPI002FCCBB43
MNIRKLYIAMLLISPACLALSADEHNKNTSMTHVISDYRMSLAALPLDYSLQEKKTATRRYAAEVYPEFTGVVSTGHSLSGILAERGGYLYS